MIPHNYRIVAYNDTGQNLAVAVYARGKRKTEAAIETERAERTLLAETALANGAYGHGTPQINNFNWEELDLNIVCTSSGGAAGDCVVYLQNSSDKGIRWPSDGQGTILATITLGASETIHESLMY